MKRKPAEGAPSGGISPTSGGEAEAPGGTGSPQTGISVIVCTHNRARHLREALESVLPQLSDRHGSELIVVDNRSTDETAMLVAGFASRGVRYVFEPEIGLCNARNRGWREARGRYVAYLDDDAVADPGWLRALVDAFDRTPEPGIVGGRVEPIWEEAPPPWLSEELALGLTIVDWSEEPRVISDVRTEWLVGTNMALPRAVLERVGGFHPKLDRSGSNMLSSGDVFLQKKVMKAGYPCFYHPRMAVRHRIDRSRLRQEWFRRRYYWQGISDAKMEQIEAAPSPVRRLGSATRRALRLLASPRQLLWLIAPTSDAGRFTRKCMGLIEVGHIAGSLGAAGR